MSASEASTSGETRQQRRRSRYPRPGTLASAWWETETHQPRMAQVAVMATSRHRWALSKDDALGLLRREYGPAASIARVGWWRSVTQNDVECGGVGDADAGDWCEDGSGAAWVQVAYPDDASLNGGQS